MLWMLIAALPVSLAAPSPTCSADELIAKSAEARGGWGPLKAMSSLRMEGDLLLGGGQLRAPWVKQVRRSGEVRQELSIQGLTQVFAWDGQEGWTINPFGGRKDPERVAPDTLKWLIEGAPIEGALLGASSAGLPITCLGRKDIEGTLAYELQITRPGGDVLLVYLDPDWFLELRVVSRHTEHGALVESSVDFGDYEKVDGVYFPFLIETGPKGAASADRTKLEIERITLNVELNDALFHFPAPEVR